MRFRGQGFTLIELMIAIALIAIMMAVATYTFMEFGALQRDIEFSHSLTQASSQLRELRTADFATLPPQVLAVNSSGKVKLAQSDLVEASIKVYDATTSAPIPDFAYSAKSGELSLKGISPGRKVIVNYDFYVASQNMSFFADSKGEVNIKPAPEFKIQNVFIATGDALTEVSDFKMADGVLKLSQSAADKLIVVDYLDSETRNKVTSRFLNEGLKSTENVSDVKLLEVQEPYNGGWKMSLPLVRAAAK